MTIPAHFDAEGYNVVKSLPWGGLDTSQYMDAPEVDTVLGAGGTFNGHGWKEVSDWAELVLIVASDQASAAGGLRVRWSHDAAVEDTLLRDTFTVAAAAEATPNRWVFARKARFYSITYVNGAFAQTRSIIYPHWSSTVSIGGGIGTGGSSGPSTPGASASVAVAVNAVVNIATCQVGKRYRVSIEGGEGVCIRCDATDPVTTNEAWRDGQKFEFNCITASGVTVRAIKRVAGSANLTVVVTALDGGTVV